MALSYKRGKHPNASEEVRRLADSMSEQQLHDFAATKTTGLPKRAASVAAIGAGLAGLGTLAGGAIAPKGHRLEGASRGVANTVSGINGSLLGGAAGGGLAHLLSSRRLGFMNKMPGKLTETGLLLGALGGGIAGVDGMQHVMGAPSWKSAAARIPFADRPADRHSLLQDATAGRDLLQKVYDHPDKQVGVNDVLDGNSMTMPFNALKILGGAGAGAVGGGLLAKLLTPTITPDMQEFESAPIRKHRRVASGIGAVLGAAYAGRGDLQKSTLLHDLRAKLSV